MYQHFIAIASCYQLGTRIAWHCSDHKIQPEQISIFRDKALELNCSNYSIHKLQTDSKSWESVLQKDSFFSDLKVMSVDEFFDALCLDKKIIALDIAQYLISSIDVSNLKLQKLLYFVYANYLIKYNKKLFDENFKAFQYGPAIPFIYRKYKKFGKDIIRIKYLSKAMATSKILQADDGIQILNAIDDVVKRFGHKSANELVAITHKSGSPWHKTKKDKKITDECIIQNHITELICL